MSFIIFSFSGEFMTSWLVFWHRACASSSTKGYVCLTYLSVCLSVWLTLLSISPVCLWPVCLYDMSLSDLSRSESCCSGSRELDVGDNPCEDGGWSIYWDRLFSYWWSSGDIQEPRHELQGQTIMMIMLQSYMKTKTVTPIICFNHIWSETVTVCCVCRGCSSTCLIRTTRWWTTPSTQSSESTTGWFISRCPSFSSTVECSLTTQQESSRWTLLMRRSWPPQTLRSTTQPKITTHPQNHHRSSKLLETLKTSIDRQNHHRPPEPPQVLKKLNSLKKPTQMPCALKPPKQTQQRLVLWAELTPSIHCPSFCLCHCVVQMPKDLEMLLRTTYFGAIMMLVRRNTRETAIQYKDSRNRNTVKN